MKSVLCPQCHVNPVVRRSRLGTPPRCIDCLKSNQRGRYDRLNAKRRDGLKDGHRNSSGQRYSDRSLIKTVSCRFCGDLFEDTTKRSPLYKHTCLKCLPSKQEASRVRKLARIAERYREDPGIVKRRRLSLVLERAGLSLDWYDKETAKGCGVCGISNPGSKGWQIDHDHKCCPYGTRAGCAKCIRGILCNSCNLGLGHLRDDPALFKAALSYLEKHSTRQPQLS